MFRFEESFILWFLIFIPFCFLVFHLSNKWKQSQIEKVGDYKVFSRLFPNWSLKREWLKASLLLIAMSMLLISWANPQWGNRKQKIKAKSSDVIIALDISQSMLATDISPNRMERSKFFLNELIKKLRGDRIGLVYFAGSAYLQMPLTNDYASAETFIKSANPTQAGTQGTVIADAIEMAQSIFSDDKAAQKALIVISDGENHESEAIEAAKTALENGIFVFTIGVGTTEGSRIPIVEKGKRVYKTDRSGNPVTSALNVSMLKDIAEAGGGQFYSLDQTMSALNKIDREIDKLEKQEVEQRSFTDYNSYFQYFLFLAILLLTIEYFISNLSNRNRSWKSIFGI
ncbi:MAG: VWA domain-containing protein [Saprospiraceae bacterium]|nr:VWA domain-containing protein [Bacteroidia bacterium]NNE14484.1 VWA domain-containing protein [Saprospiraceae bacterium]NNL92481.1 VWA domain-containing protein [Saprospiraceae bacterium]